MANMTFGVNLLPNNTGGQKTLGNSSQKWKIYTDDINGFTLPVAQDADEEILTTSSINDYRIPIIRMIT